MTSRVLIPPRLLLDFFAWPFCVPVLLVQGDKFPHSDTFCGVILWYRPSEIFLHAS